MSQISGIRSGYSRKEEQIGFLHNFYGKDRGKGGRWTYTLPELKKAAEKKGPWKAGQTRAKAGEKIPR